MESVPERSRALLTTGPPHAGRSDLVFSHGLCPPCADDTLAELDTEWENQDGAQALEGGPSTVN